MRILKNIFPDITYLNHSIHGKTQLARGGGNSEYSTPTLETLEVSTEKGFAQSLVFGEEGYPGSDLGDGTDFGSF